MSGLGFERFHFVDYCYSIEAVINSLDDMLIASQDMDSRSTRSKTYFLQHIFSVRRGILVL